MKDELPLPELRQRWSEAWGMTPHARIGRSMLEASLAYKKRELAGEGFSAAERVRLAQLVKQYRRNPQGFAGRSEIKSGTRLVKNWNGQRHSVLSTDAGYEYCGKQYGSLSQVAFAITGTRWNGWTFFGLKEGKSA